MKAGIFCPDRFLMHLKKSDSIHLHVEMALEFDRLSQDSTK